MRIGLSYDQGTPKYDAYRLALLEAAQVYGHAVELVWLADRRGATGRELWETLDALVLTGGADVTPQRYGFDDPDGLCIHALPERDEAELPIVEFALERHLPMLAICRGMQFLNVVLGGTLIPDLPGHERGDDGWRHDVAIEPGSRLAALIGSNRASVSSSHHQAVDRPGAGLRVVARARGGIVEALEWEHSSSWPWLLAVQWHPERMRLDEPAAGTLYRAFLVESERNRRAATIS